uniref:Uncharacterized protein n=1 Tax=Cacopsylla melanoneura TaxID=428564 RepID=A0A8D9A0S8_9HEMI
MSQIGPVIIYLSRILLLLYNVSLLNYVFNSEVYSDRFNRLPPTSVSYTSNYFSIGHNIFNIGCGFFRNRFFQKNILCPTPRESVAQIFRHRTSIVFSRFENLRVSQSDLFVDFRCSGVFDSKSLGCCRFCFVQVRTSFCDDTCYVFTCDCIVFSGSFFLVFSVGIHFSSVS